MFVRVFSFLLQAHVGVHSCCKNVCIFVVKRFSFMLQGCLYSCCKGVCIPAARMFVSLL